MDEIPSVHCVLKSMKRGFWCLGMGSRALVVRYAGALLFLVAYV